jgi:putative mRNA 3-end processing factor
LPGARVTSKDGIQVDVGGKRFLLDPSNPRKADYVFVSHAHVDHMHNPSAGEKVISSVETSELALARGYNLGKTVDEVEGVELLDSGHILGSRAILIDDEVYYTGDASGRERAFLGTCKTKHAKALIMETTYGSPEYEFPPTAKLVREVNDLIGDLYHRGKPVILMGYPLGKAQLLCYFFSSWGPLYVHARVADMNEVHVRHGVPLREGIRFDPEKDADKLPHGPWTMIAPMTSNRNGFMSQIRKRHGAVTIAFSGWALNGSNSRSLGADASFPLSDHCDYPELLKLAEQVSPEVVYTTHGFADEFAEQLRSRGFTARTLGSDQSTLHEYPSDG